MSSRNALHWCLALSVVTTAQLILATGLILLPQWRIQQTAHRGIVSFVVDDDGTVRLWNRPIANQSIPNLLTRAQDINPSARVRVILSPGVRWGTAQNLLGQFQGTSLEVDLQLPNTKNMTQRFGS